MKYIFIALISYCLGSIPFSYLIGKYIYKSDIRTKGSKNPGTTNAFRSYGKLAGILTLLLDFSKGVLAVYIGYKLAGYDGKVVGLLFAPVGHMFSFILNFKGGKGVATTAGSLLAFDYRVLITVLSIFIIIFLITKIVSISSIIATLSTIFVVLYLYGISSVFRVILIIASLIVILHRENIKRLIKKEEKRII